jgi:transposase
MRLIARIHCVRPEFEEIGSWYLLHEIHRRILRGLSPSFGGNERIPVLSRPSYSSGLAPADFLFRKLKIAMKGTRFEAVSSIQQTVTRELKAIREEAFSGTFDSLHE